MSLHDPPSLPADGNVSLTWGVSAGAGGYWLTHLMSSRSLMIPGRRAGKRRGNERQTERGSGPDPDQAAGLGLVMQSLLRVRRCVTIR